MAAGENWCVLGQYFTHLKPMKQLYQKWQAGNLFKAMTNDYVRVVFKDTEMHDRSYEINTYLKEHYYEDANFSIEAVANRTVIGRYLQNFDSNDLYAISGDASVSYRKDSSYSGMSEIHLSNFDINGFSLMQDESYLAIHSGNGRTYTFTTMSEGEGQLKAIFYNDIVQEKGSYTVDFIYDHNGQLHVVSLGALPR